MSALALNVSDGLSLNDAAVAQALPGVLITLHGGAVEEISAFVLDLVKGDTLPVLVFELVDADGGIYDLDEANVRFRMRARDGATYKVDALCIVGSSGLAQYMLGSTDTNSVGEYLANVKMTTKAGRVYRSEKFIIRIREAL